MKIISLLSYIEVGKDFAVIYPLRLLAFSCLYIKRGREKGIGEKLIYSGNISGHHSGLCREIMKCS